MAMNVNWYRIEMLSGQDTYCYFGSSKLSEKEMTEAIGQQKFIQLSNLTYFDEEGDPKRWSEWEPHYHSRVHLNPKFIISVIPMMDDPHQSESTGNKVLKYPASQAPDEE
jgi:hypothetical protein